MEDRGWDDNIKMDLKEIRWKCVEWIALSQFRDKCRTLLNAVMDL